ncbi:methionyl-tRNA formyltransferase [Kiloniella laminariae]|uniref:Methionyl-tRNA formyltransferase n=1 Tax=Kiloniella laminariae TaxID=454162 RepID=A0ABT4LKG3_9PROT|nr:methionyl-tRNA formyltransferase [Kiloniella laminariae]MCZ4281591.1 methionyl-tRNA formyltransferase [Kiloniella laminariae]
MKKLRIAFMGTPDFSVPCLKALADAGHEIAAVYSQPPRPAGRGHKEKLSPVHAYAESQGWPVYTPKSFRRPEVLEEFASLGVDVAVVIAYGLILPQAALDIPPMGCVNIHASLLPRWRGAAPIQRAIEAGDAESGVAIMQMAEELDAGDVILESRVPLNSETTASSLHDELSSLGADLIIRALEGMAKGEIKPQPQPLEGVTYAQKLSREESALDWSQPAEELERKIRALTPWPGVHFTFQGEKIKILKARLSNLDSTHSRAGTLLDDQLTVACGAGALQIERLQRPGKGGMEATAFLNGYPLPKGTHLVDRELT